MTERRPIAHRQRGGPDDLRHYIPDEATRLTLRAAVGPEESAQTDLTTWERTVDLNSGLDAGMFRLLPLIAERIERLGLQGDHSGRIAGTAKMSWVRNQRQLFGGRAAIDALSRGDLRVTLLKGAALTTLDRLPGTRTRPMADVDLLVDAVRGPAALQLLTDAGWVPDPDVRMSFLPWRHSIGMTLPGSPAIVDLHWRITNFPVPSRWEKWLRAGTTTSTMVGAPVHVPAPDRLLAHAIQHGAQSNAESPIRWAADVHLLASYYGDGIDWEAIAAFATAIRMSRRFFACLSWLSEYLDTPIPAETLAALGRRTSLLERMEVRNDKSRNGFPRRAGEFASVWWRADPNLAWSAALGTEPHFIRDKWGVSKRRELLHAARRRVAGIADD
ncbi:nucleotidyltransferase family protein [Smaragdicoccus niigatensis]|uniref:nucleotidyltransferase family protein n=1 Tax=Smaragdicoccus niigatensis TaxID=359359 RepID=UPI00037B2D01|nr:nucleotidyltransferase family protein [Smaragdicoccus niigatensis]